MSLRARPGFLWALLLVLVGWLGLTGAQVAVAVPHDGGFIAGIGVAIGIGLPGLAFAVKLLVSTIASMKGGGVNPEAIRGEVIWQVELSAAIRDLGKTQERLAVSMDNQAEHFRLYVEDSEQYRARGDKAMGKIDAIHAAVIKPKSEGA